MINQRDECANARRMLLIDVKQMKSSTDFVECVRDKGCRISAGHNIYFRAPRVRSGPHSVLTDGVNIQSIWWGAAENSRNALVLHLMYA